MHTFMSFIAACSIAALGFFESAFLFGWPMWASCMVTATAAWAGAMVFATAQPKPIPAVVQPQPKPMFEKKQSSENSTIEVIDNIEILPPSDQPKNPGPWEKISSIVKEAAQPDKEDDNG